MAAGNLVMAGNIGSSDDGCHGRTSQYARSALVRVAEPLAHERARAQTAMCHDEASPVDTDPREEPQPMAKIQVLSETRAGEPAEVMLSEHVAAGLLESEHYAAQLIERMRWAAADAEDREDVER
jgi:hypothetical protein